VIKRGGEQTDPPIGQRQSSNPTTNKKKPPQQTKKNVHESKTLWFQNGKGVASKPPLYKKAARPGNIYKEKDKQEGPLLTNSKKKASENGRFAEFTGEWRGERLDLPNVTTKAMEKGTARETKAVLNEGQERKVGQSCSKKRKEETCGCDALAGTMGFSPSGGEQKMQGSDSGRSQTLHRGGGNNEVDGGETCLRHDQ